MLETIKATLRAAGLAVYDYAEKAGTCKAAYVVVYDGGVEITPGSKGMYGRHSYEAVCLAPYGDVDGLAALASRVRLALEALPQLRLSAAGPAGVEQPYQARSLSLTYATMERIR